MKLLQISLWLTVCCGILSVGETFSQPPVKSKPSPDADWSALFPEIPNCLRIIEPLTRNGKIFEQRAVYERPNYQTDKGKNPNYFGCGSIALSFKPSARKLAETNYMNITLEPFFIPPQKLKMRNFDAYGDSPLCGNDIWIGSTTVYFAENMSLSVSANMGGTAILEFAENADYKLLKKKIAKFVKSKS